MLRLLLRKKCFLIYFYLVHLSATSKRISSHIQRIALISNDNVTRVQPTGLSKSLCTIYDVENRICEAYDGDFCNTTITNNTFVSRNSTISFKVTELAFQQLFYLLEGENCRSVVKWFSCASIFPICENNHTIKALPCREVCTLMTNTLCQPQWNSIIKVQRLLFNHVVIPSCSIFPSYDGESTTCLYPSFIKELQPNTNNKNSSVDILLLISSIAGSLLLVIAVLILVKCLRRNKRDATKTLSVFLNEISDVHRSSSQNDRYANLDSISQSYTNLNHLVDALGIHVFIKHDLEYEKKLGEGAFGKVVRCKTRNQSKGDCVKTVAVKYLKKNASAETEQNFCKEIEILSNFNHPNVIPLLGVCLDAPKCLVLEFMEHGDLNKYIRMRSGCFHALAGSYGNLPDGIEFSSPELSFRNLLLITYQIANGLEYLAAKRFVHRDIATRNILVGDDLLVKVSDFGLAHDIYGSDYYTVDTQKMLPLRWLSPEALSLGRFTLHSDVWAFGITIWEIFTYGMQPFFGCSNDEVCQRIRCLKLPQRPYCCPNKVYDLMLLCWKFAPNQRKRAADIKRIIRTWLDDNEPFIENAWKRLLIPPLADRTPTIKRAKMKYLNIRTEITL